MTSSTLKFSGLIGFALLAGFLCPALMVLSACAINALPRSMGGERVLAPWPACLLGSLFVSVVLPWAVSLPLIRDRWSAAVFSHLLGYR